jgi:hypothetical protein
MHVAPGTTMLLAFRDLLLHCVGVRQLIVNCGLSVNVRRLKRSGNHSFVIKLLASMHVCVVLTFVTNITCISPNRIQWLIVICETGTEFVGVIWMTSDFRRLVAGESSQEVPASFQVTTYEVCFGPGGCERVYGISLPVSSHHSC